MFAVCICVLLLLLLLSQMASLKRPETSVYGCERTGLAVTVSR